MPLTILCFGQINAITGQSSFSWPHTADTATLQVALQTQYPGLSTATYRMAVDKVLISEVQVLHEGAVVALLPPFSGG